MASHNTTTCGKFNQAMNRLTDLTLDAGLRALDAELVVPPANWGALAGRIDAEELLAGRMDRGLRSLDTGIAIPAGNWEKLARRLDFEDGVQTAAELEDPESGQMAA